MIEKRLIRVIIIEDDEFIIMVYHDLIKQFSSIKFEIEVYGLLEDGIEAIANKSYDILLLDLNLPDSNYIQTIERIPQLSLKVPVMIMTSTNDELLALKTMNRGGQDYLVKTNLDANLFIRSVLFSIERHQLTQQLKAEKDRSDSLLRNILPQTIAEELKHDGTVVAKYHPIVSVMFIDFAQFTKLTVTMNPNELVSELHACFSHFDTVIERYGLEKIKTIGDSYMCAGGIPNFNSNHVINMVNAAIEINTYTENRFKEKEAEGKPYWQARIGIHVGPATAGVVGSKKFTYDIWGNTVNTASRMESSSEAGKINVSEITYEFIKDKFKCAHRGKISAKGKGEMDMYFVESIG
jgi:class 3 adenylate cyclase